MTLTKLSGYTLYLSFFLYIGMILPQVIYNFKRRSVDGLSWTTHLVLMTSYICDIGYALGTKMPWQYYTVPMVELSALLAQHAQFRVYRRENPPRAYVLATALLLLLGATTTALLLDRTNYISIFPLLGFVSLTGWNIANLPQIILNFRIKSTEGLVVSYAFVGSIAHFCDTISAYGLHWGLPNRIGAPFALFLGLILICQYFAYRRPAHRPLCSE